jgi:hypothetical protein
MLALSVFLSISSKASSQVPHNFSNLLKSKVKDRTKKLCSKCNKTYIFKHSNCKFKEIDTSAKSTSESSHSNNLSNDVNFTFLSDSLSQNEDPKFNQTPQTWTNKLDSFCSEHINKMKILHLNVNLIFCKFSFKYFLMLKSDKNFILTIKINKLFHMFKIYIMNGKLAFESLLQPA